MLNYYRIVQLFELPMANIHVVRKSNMGFIHNVSCHPGRCIPYGEVGYVQLPKLFKPLQYFHC